MGKTEITGHSFKSSMRKYAILLLLIFLTSCSASQDIYQKTFLLMGTVVNIKVPESDISKEAVDKAYLRMKEISSVFTIFDSESEISVINNMADKEGITVSDDVIRMMEMAVYLNEKSDDAFDITVESLEELWGFYKKDVSQIPALSDIRETQKSVGMQDIILNREEHKVSLLKKGIMLDFSAVAKGYSVDGAIEVLRGYGIDGALVDAGGDMYCLGKNNGRDWIVGIRHPEKRDEIAGRLYLQDKACATSGGYENFQIIDGKTFSHIIDPRTGYPVDNGVLSVTVIADSCAVADGFATAFFVLGAERGLEIAEENDDIDCVIITKADDEMRFHVSSGLEEKVELDIGR